MDGLEAITSKGTKDDGRVKGYPTYVGSGKFVESLGYNQSYALDKKYLVRNEIGEIVEKPGESIYRMAKTMADVELQYGKSQEYVDEITENFYWMIANSEFSPAGRIWTNAGTHIKGLFNCYVLPVPDDLSGIFESVRNAAIIHKNGGGTGYNFSELRPRGTYVQKSKGIASGVVSFISQFDKETEVINSGNRRGANMGIVDVTHPDIIDFIYAKAVRGEITNFNVSIGAFDSFMKAVEDNEYYNLEFPRGEKFHYSKLEQIVRNIEQNKIGGAEVGEEPKPASLKPDMENGNVNPGKTKVIDSYSGKVAGRIAEEGTVQLYAPYVLETVAKLAWKTGDPGMIFLDAINRHNPLSNKGSIRATNPCGEQPLHPYDACNLGSIILSNMIKISESGRREVDYDKLERTTILATRFMDNVNDANKGPIPEVEKTVLSHRRIGMGVMGWADMLAELRIPYDSEEAYSLAEEVMGFITDTAKKASVELAKEKGVFPAFEGSIYDDGNPENRVRNVERTTIAPTGTISMLYDVASGIEPFFAVAWIKKIRGGDKLLYTLPQFVSEAEKRGLDLEKILPLIKENHGNIQNIEGVPDDLKRIFKTAHDIPYEAHIKMQTAFQMATDNAVSKTINMANNVTVEDVRNAYFLAWKNDLKGITVYRDGSKDVQVLETGHGKDDGKPAQGTIENPLKLPPMMPSIRIRQQTPFGNMHVQVVVDPKRDYAPVETFATIGSAGGQEIATLEGLGRLTSMWLKSGGNLEQIIDQIEGIGSGISTTTSGGRIQSLEMGFSKALTKYEIAKRQNKIVHLLAGNLDYTEFDLEVSEILRRHSDVKGGWKKYDPKKEQQGNDESEQDNKLQSFSKNGPTYGVKCPECDIGKLAFEEGCKKCYACGYSEC